MKKFVRRLGTAVVVIALALVLLTVGVLFWANMVMRGDREAALDAWRNPAVSIESTEHSIVMTPTGEASGDGLVFIPGARVDPYAYLYKLSGIVEASGVTVVITKPTLNLAFFDQRPLSTFTADAPEVDEWAVGGHSLGGVRACQLADAPDVTGLVLFGSYCANDLSAADLTVLSIGGSEDALSTPDKIEEAAHLLPDSAVFVEIDGLNHAGFGDYGRQSGDGEASIDRTQARTEITDALVEFFE